MKTKVQSMSRTEVGYTQHDGANLINQHNYQFGMKDVPALIKNLPTFTGPEFFLYDEMQSIPPLITFLPPTS